MQNLACIQSLKLAKMEVNPWEKFIAYLQVLRNPDLNI